MKLSYDRFRIKILPDNDLEMHLLESLCRGEIILLLEPYPVGPRGLEIAPAPRPDPFVVAFNQWMKDELGEVGA